MTLTDYDPALVDIIERNISRNLGPAAAAVATISRNLGPAAAADAAAAAASCAPEARALDFRHFDAASVASSFASSSTLAISATVGAASPSVAA